MGHDAREFLRLEKNWDSYDGRPTNPKAIEIAEAIGQMLWTSGLVPQKPWFTPLNGGGIQIEYTDTSEYDVEIVIDADRWPA